MDSKLFLKLELIINKLQLELVKSEHIRETIEITKNTPDIVTLPYALSVTSMSDTIIQTLDILSEIYDLHEDTESL